MTYDKRAYDKARYQRIREDRIAARDDDLIEFLTAEDCAYIAGLVDGEGSIYVMKHREKTFYAAISICMTHEGVLQWLAEKVGLSVSKIPRTNEGWRDQYGFRIHGKRAMRLCERMLPYLKVKRRQAELIVTFPAEARRAPGRLLSDETNAIRLRLRQEINGLNTRGLLAA